MAQNGFSQTSTEWFWTSPEFQAKLDDPNSEFGNSDGLKQGPCYIHIIFKPNEGVVFCKYDPNNHSKCFLDITVESFLNGLKGNPPKGLKLVAYSVAPDELNLIVEFWNLHNPLTDKGGIIDKVKGGLDIPDTMNIHDIECIPSELLLKGLLEYMRSARDRYEHPVDGKNIYVP